MQQPLLPRGRLLALALLASAAVGVPPGAPPRLLLVGWTGDGKTHFCNAYDGTVCPQEGDGSGEESATQEVYFGRSILDSPGFGDNREAEPGSDALQASLRAVEKTLAAIDTVPLRAIGWMVPCAERRTKQEAFDLMNLFMDMVGRGVPVIAIFNPGSAENKCIKKQDDFRNKALQHGIKLSEIIHLDDFSMRSFEQTYTAAFQVMVPGDLRQILQRRDPRFLASKLKEIRKLKCEALPGELQSLRASLTDTQAAVRGEDTVPQCKQAKCAYTQPHIGDCPSYTLCVERRESCGGWGPFKSCDTYCSREQVVQDEGCLQRNSDAAARADEMLRACKGNADAEMQRCLESRAQVVADLREKNEGLKKSAEVLVRDEELMLAKMRTCDEAAGMRRGEL